MTRGWKLPQCPLLVYLPCATCIRIQQCLICFALLWSLISNLSFLFWSLAAVLNLLLFLILPLEASLFTLHFGLTDFTPSPPRSSLWLVSIINNQYKVDQIYSHMLVGNCIASNISDLCSMACMLLAGTACSDLIIANQGIVDHSLFSVSFISQSCGFLLPLALLSSSLQLNTRET